MLAATQFLYSLCIGPSSPRGEHQWLIASWVVVPAGLHRTYMTDRGPLLSLVCMHLPVGLIVVFVLSSWGRLDYQGHSL